MELYIEISDFGLSKICPKNQQTTYVDTGVKGTFGYLDPDYVYNGKLTRKSDVYAFGVILFEVLCRKRAVDRSIDEEQWGLAVWARKSIKEGRLKQIVDSNIRESISSRCLKEFAQLAKQCLHKHPKQRPTMAEVVVGLDSILVLQEKTNNTLQPTGIPFFRKKGPIVMIPSNDKNSGGENQTLRRFDFVTISVATKNFSEENRISQLKTDDSLYKGRLQNGQGIAVARIPFITKYECFMEEASILVKFEHENLAKLLGYCIEGTYLFFVYEFALNATLDCLMFDPECSLLNWDKRRKIILGTARALLYLHRDAPIRIIHGAVKPENILLDENLNPILLSFVNTRYADIYTSTGMTLPPMINETGPHKAPEYLPYANVSTKTDVYSFGVLVLETVTKHRVLDSVYPFENVKRNWLGRTISNITHTRMDVDSSSVTRFFEIGLLCVQNDAEDRPTMEEVVSMLLGSSSLTLPMAKMQEVFTRGCSNSTGAHVDNYDVYNSDECEYDTGEVSDIEELSPR